MDVPINVRSHEAEQLQEWTPKVEQTLRSVGRDDEADTIESIYDEHVSEFETRAHSDTPYISMDADDWRALVRNLDRIDDDEGKNRVWWLRKKLVSRLRDRMEELEDDEEDE